MLNCAAACVSSVTYLGLPQIDTIRLSCEHAHLLQPVTPSFRPGRPQGQRDIYCQLRRCCAPWTKRPAVKTFPGPLAQNKQERQATQKPSTKDTAVLSHTAACPFPLTEATHLSDGVYERRSTPHARDADARRVWIPSLLGTTRDSCAENLLNRAACGDDVKATRTGRTRARREGGWRRGRTWKGHRYP